MTKSRSVTAPRKTASGRSAGDALTLADEETLGEALTLAWQNSAAAARSRRK